MLVGRWPSGAPPSRTPDADDPGLGGDELADNHLLYADDTPAPRLRPGQRAGADPYPQARSDLRGRACPLVAHVRAMSRRGAATDLGAPGDTFLRLMVRRGIPYGEPYAEETADADRGLLFLACMASVEDQFELVTRHWASRRRSPSPQGRTRWSGSATRPVTAAASWSCPDRAAAPRP
jgi:deferrochelatase/peroxidase EfeB